MSALLEASGLAKTYAVPRTAFQPARRLTAVAHVDLALVAGGTLGLVGESGCGKSTLARLLLRLTPVSAGRIVFDGQDITTLGEGALRPLRRRLQLVHQNPSAALDPRLTAAQAIAEPLVIQRLAGGSELRDRVAQLLSEVGLGPEFLRRYPHELSGGQKQRVCIARALAPEPQVLVLDEPTSALDVSVQAQMLDMLAELRSRRGLAYLFISHNLAVVRQVCAEVAVMYLGRIVEQGSAEQVFSAPRHPYTQALLASVPRLTGGPVQAATPGEPPNPAAVPAGCPFHPRCRRAEPSCRTGVPPPLVQGLACPPAAGL
ncbi:MAG TPA: ABC transporter ATP-binding protein [Reyranella sp.]|nr:ABC transporter ATP-binding protein [Reyranella sp.]